METEIFFAFATDNKKDFSDEHFGSAKYYLIYGYKDNKLNFAKEITNITPEEETHGDPNKADSVGKLMKSNNVKILVAKAMGPNIIRMRRTFVPVISRIKSIKETIKKIEQEKIQEILKELKSEDDKNVVYIS